ncbi:MAG: ATP-dependent DNA helicase RecG [Lachnospiraceae bacterium]|nr:ATP-dependent DNA helicase RecG [Lachnospiraceae bacterium]
MDINSEISKVKGVGAVRAEAFHKLGIMTVHDLAMHFPRAYDIFMPPVSLGKLRNGYVETIAVTLTSPAKLVSRGGKKSIVMLSVREGTESATLMWFNLPFIRKTLTVGKRLFFRGRVSMRGRSAYIIQPQIYTPEEYAKLCGLMQPVYKLSAGLSNEFIRKTVLALTDVIKSGTSDYLTRKDLKALSLMDWAQAIVSIHSPRSGEDYVEARHRLAFDELIGFAYEIKTLRDEEKLPEPVCTDKEIRVCNEFLKSLPFEPTKAQKYAINDVMTDITKDLFSTRLVQGDVGCGKTLVAMYALLACALAGKNACCLAPTRVLAMQHYRDMKEAFAPYGVEVLLYVGGMSKKERERIAGLAGVNTGDESLGEESFFDEDGQTTFFGKGNTNQNVGKKGCVIVGTHAVLRDGTNLGDPAVVVIDEQHRFGVKQREYFMRKDKRPYTLVMSATPIPRSLAMVMYGDRNVSVIDEMPAGRLRIKNCVVGPEKRGTSYDFIAARVAEGRQAYVICPMIEESEELDASNVTDYAQALSEEFKDKGITVGCLHGKMKAQEKDDVLDAFYRGETDVLVSTTVVEVGVNVPNATVMMIENAERFGLAQLHQLRGRIARSTHQGYCIFIKNASSELIDKRLDILVEYNDGMLVAQKDLELRGPGDMFGVQQSGEVSFGLADITTDSQILKDAMDFLDSMDQKALDDLLERGRGIIEVRSEADVL